MKKVTIATILPAHNEEMTVGQTVKKLDSIMRNGLIVVVDNASTDQTRQIAEKHLSNLKNNKGKLLIENNKGKSLAVRKALEVVDADIYVMCDADDTYDLRDFQNLVDAIELEGYEMSVADRHTLGEYAASNTRRFHTLGNRVIPIIVNVLYGSSLKDVLSGFRAFSSTFVKSYPFTVQGFELEVDLTLHALDKKLSIKEIPSRYRDRPDGSSSKLRTVSDGSRIVRLIFRLARYYRPFAFFSVLSLITFIFGLLLGSAPILDYIKFHFVYHIPLAVLATTLMLISLMFFLIGITLDSIKDTNQRIYALSRKSSF